MPKYKTEDTEPAGTVAPESVKNDDTVGCDCTMPDDDVVGYPI